jgi:hypothetical protein
MQDNLERLLTEAEATCDAERTTASSRLKSRIYSALMQQHAAEGPLRSLSDTHADGRGLCVFEAATRVCTPAWGVQQLNLCRVCHARVLGERVEGAPIFWHNCPYVDFQNR